MPDPSHESPSPSPRKVAAHHSAFNAARGFTRITPTPARARREQRSRAEVRRQHLIAAYLRELGNRGAVRQTL